MILGFVLAVLGMLLVILGPGVLGRRPVAVSVVLGGVPGGSGDDSGPGVGSVNPGDGSGSRG